MNRNLYYVFTAISFALLVAAPGRFAFGIIICLELFFLIFTGFLFSYLLKKLLLHEMNSIVTVLGLIFSTVLYKQIIMAVYPLIALQMSFVFYLPAVSSYMIGIIYKNIDASTKISVIDNLKITSYFSIFALVFYAIRDIFGYGTFTLPSPNGIFEKQLLSSDNMLWGTFFASIPGALVLVCIVIFIFIHAQKKIKIVRRAEESK
ncbi:MAG: hypothetical protein IK002_10820 [Treponema sp.]|uniref:hypothetical protein n=1 Tax=Treponema sp. TaxID=166 RepID=UPI00298DA651|nr:hypothetical protein [Treponema sp.]MBR5934465.1 hypothetical protein [Treponema sp.]